MEREKSLFKSWVEAARPKTLPASLSPVLLACVLAWCEGVFRLIPALLCFGVALLAQIASNFANDYFDFKKGADREDRLGPERAVAQGWITPKAMLKATFLTLGLSCFCGCMLLFYAGWELIPVGIAIALCVLAYSAGPFRWPITVWAMSAWCCFTGSSRYASPIIYRRCPFPCYHFCCPYRSDCFPQISLS